MWFIREAVLIHLYRWDTHMVHNHPQFTHMKKGALDDQGGIFYSKYVAYFTKWIAIIGFAMTLIAMTLFAMTWFAKTWFAMGLFAMTWLAVTWFAITWFARMWFAMTWFAVT